MIALVEDRSRTPGLEKREMGSFRNLTWLCKPYMLARGGCAVRRERWTREGFSGKAKAAP